MTHTANYVCTNGQFKQFKVSNQTINVPTDVVRYLTDLELNDYLTEVMKPTLHGERVFFIS